MQTNFNPNISNNQINFQSLKKVNGIKFNKFVEQGNVNAEHDLVSSLMQNDSFKTLCEKYDVFVNIKNVFLGSGILLSTGLSLKIFAQKIDKDKTLLGLFKIKEKFLVARSPIPDWIGANPRELASVIKQCYINEKDGLEADINYFLRNN